VKQGALNRQRPAPGVQGLTLLLLLDPLQGRQLLAVGGDKGNPIVSTSFDVEKTREAFSEIAVRPNRQRTRTPAR
jgi:hypothetical protein